MRTRLLGLISLLFAVTSIVSAQTYCTTGLYQTGCTDDDYVESFSTTGGITNITNNNTGCSNTSATDAYTYFSTQTHTAVQGSVVNFSFTNNPVFSEHYKIWVDWNNDGTFNETDERVYYNGTTKIAAGATVTGSFTIPLTAVPGLKRLRIRCVFSSGTTHSACSSENWGETEDYNLNVISLTPCSGIPNAGNATSTISNILCPGSPFTLSLANASTSSGLTYQWQSSTDNTNWANISGATNFTHTTTQTAAIIYYRAIVKCTNSGDSSFSASIGITNGGGPTYAPLPFTESFENAWMNTCNPREIPNNSWRNTPGTGNSSWRRNDDGASASWTALTTGAYTPASSDGSFSARFHTAAATAGSTGTFDLYLDCNTPASNKRLRFDYINTTGNDSVVVYLSTNGGTSFTRLDSVRTSATWKTKTIVFASNSATTIIRFRAFSDAVTTDFGLDNVRVNNFDNCSGAPVGGTSATSANNVCVTTPFTLSVTGATDANGLTYQWEKADTLFNGSFGPFTPITGATDLNFTTTQGITTQYRLKVTCTLDNSFSYSTVVTVKSPPTLNGIYTIDKTAPASELWPNPGKNTFLSFNSAITAMSCGITGPVIFNVATGTGPYNEQVIVTGKIPGSSSVNTITFYGMGETLTFSPTASERAVLKLNGAKYMRFDSLIITATNTTQSYGVQLINNADSNVISRCTINVPATSTTTSFAGIVISGSATDAIGTTTPTLCDSNTIRNNIINGGFYGITLASSTTGASGFNNIEGNDIRNFHQFGIYLTGSYNTRIVRNRISRPNRTTVGNFVGIHTTSSPGLNLQNEISGNRIFNPFGAALNNTANTFTGISYDGVSSNSTEHIISNNAIYEINGMGAQTGISVVNSDGLWFFHNTISLDTAASTTATTRGFYHSSAAATLNIFWNNIVNVTRGGTALKHAIYFNSANSTVFSDYNVLYVAGTGAHVGFLTTNRTTLAAWKTATAAVPCDVNSFSQSPLFVDINNGNGLPQNASFDNRGTYVGIDTDIIGTVRNQGTPPLSYPGPDMGAWEFVPPPCTLPPVAGTIVRTRVSDCWNTPVSLGLNGNSVGGSQTFTWQVQTGNTWTNFGDARPFADTTFNQDTTFYIRAAVTCGTVTVYSDTLLNTVSQPLAAGTYTIDSSLATNVIPGVAGGNFRNFTDARNSMSCGIKGAVVFNVKTFTPTAPNTAGVYNEQIKFRYVSNSSPVNTITFKGDGIATLAFNPVTTNERAVLKLDSAKYFIFDSLNISVLAGGAYGYGVQLINDADSNIFRNCTITGNLNSASNGFAGVVINSNASNPIATGNSNCDQNLFDKNNIIGGFYGVALVGGSSALSLINNNNFTNNTISEFASFGIYVAGTNNTLIENNLFTRPTRSVITTTYGIQATSAISNNLVISKNRFTRLYSGAPTNTAAFYGIHHNSVSGVGNIVSNNMFYSLDGIGQQYGIWNNTSAAVEYYFNTISLDNQTNTGTGATAAFYQTGTATGIIFKNNIVTVRRAGTGTKHALYFGTPANTIVSSNNNLFVSGTNAHIGFYNGNRTTMADWKGNSNQDGNSLNYDPLYEDTTIGYLGYKPTLLPIDNKGVAIAGITTDITGATRNATTPDMGALEFAPPACATPLIAGTASVTPTGNICLEKPVSLNVTGHSPLGVITFQWEHADNATGPFTPLSGILYAPKYDTLSSVKAYYRAAVSCGGNTVYTDTIQLMLNPILVGGVYTIDSAAAPNTLWPLPGQTNFKSFTAAVSALQCGITDKVVFNVKNFVSDSTGLPSNTYREQIRIGYVPGTSSVKTITFQSHPANTTQSVLSFNATAAQNYTLRLDSTSNIVFKNLTINSENAAAARVIEFMGNANNDSIVNCKINMPVLPTPSNLNVYAGIYTNAFRGNRIVIHNNEINNGAIGIYFAGTSTSILSANHTITNNTVNGATGYGIFAQYVKATPIVNNTVNVSAPLAATAYGIYTNYSDSGYVINANKVNISNTTTGNIYGIYVNNSRNIDAEPASIKNNKVTATTNNAAAIFGLYLNNIGTHDAWNNVIAVRTSGNNSYGLYSNNTKSAAYYNNSVNNSSTSASTNNYAAYFNIASTSSITTKNNIFAHTGTGVTTGRAIFVSNSDLILGDYNMLFTRGTNLYARSAPTLGGTVFTNLDAVRNNVYTEFHSISGVAPAFISESDLRPDVTKDSVWAMHGRGVQIALGVNNVDIDGAYRPDSVIYGVPDLGAYEFHPTVAPVQLVGVPAVPVANQSQYFMFGTDSVMRINWGATVPPSITLQRYSGDAPIGLPSSFDSMYFYNKVNVPTPLAGYTGSVKQFYLPSWQGTIKDINTLGIGKTNKDNAWVIEPSSLVDVPNEYIFTTISLDYFDKFTGLVNPFAPPIIPDQDTSNVGRRFWVGYPANERNGSTDQLMRLYFSATQNAQIQVKVEGTNPPWIRNYFVPAGTVKVSDEIPKNGAQQVWLSNTPGVYPGKGISITSNVPISAYTHTGGVTSSAGTLLLPVGVWSYEYKILGQAQNNWGTGISGYFYVIADKDNTKVQITPSVAVKNTNPALPVNTPTTVTLNKGDIIQVIAQADFGANADVSGSVVKSIPNENGDCFPVAVFAGSMRTTVNCPVGNGASGGDFSMQQSFPVSAWGKKYLAVPQSVSENANFFKANIWRVVVKDPATAVTVNGTPITAAPYNATLVNNHYYELKPTSVAQIQPYRIEADKPIMVAQYLTGSGCGVTGGTDSWGDPEMIYISPIEQGIKKIAFMRTDYEAIRSIGLTMVVPNGGTGLSSLVIRDGNVVVPPDYVTAFPGAPEYSIVVKRWSIPARGTNPPTNWQTVVESDSAFTAITYGTGSAESYGFNAGTLVKSLVPKSNITIPTSSTGTPYSPFTCAGTPFLFNVYIPLKVTSLTWQFSKVPGLSITTDSTQINPIPKDSMWIGNQFYYVYTVQQTFVFANSGILNLPVTFTHPDIESCDNTFTSMVHVQVTPRPDPNFNVNYSGCINDTAYFHALSSTGLGLNIKSYKWNLLDADSSINQDTLKLFTTPGIKNIKLQVVTNEGCIGDTTKPVTVNPLPIVNVVSDSVAVCFGSSATVDVLNPEVGATYKWYNTPTGGTAVFTGNSFNIPAAATDSVLYIEAQSATGCISATRKKVQVKVNALPVINVDNTTLVACEGTDATFNILNADAGTTYTWYSNAALTPPAVYTGTSYVITGVTPSTPANYYITATSAFGCVSASSKQVQLTVNPKPAVEVTNANVSVCAGQNGVFTIQNPDATYTYNWYDNNNALVATGTTFTVTNPAVGTYNYTVRAVTPATCTSDALALQLTVNALPSITMAQDVVTVCENANATFTITNANATTTYNWYTNAALTGTPVYTGTAYTINNVTSTTPLNYYIVAVTNAGCSTAVAKQVQLVVNPLPTVDVQQATINICAGTTATANVQNPVTGATYTWWNAATGGTQLGTGTSYTTTSLTNSANVYVQVQSAAGCIGTQRKQVTVTVTQIPTVTLVQTLFDTCANNNVTISVQNPVSGLTYTWSGPGLTAPTGTSVTVNTAGTYSVTAKTASPVCTSTPAQATVNMFQTLATPVVSVDMNQQSPTSITYKWNTVTGAVRYEVSLTGTGAWTSVGTATTYTINNLLPNNCRKLYVRAIGTLVCQTSAVGEVEGCTLDDQMFIPNSFTPNGDGKNDVWQVYGSIIKDVKMMVFNQWGQKVYEANGTPAEVKWDGRYKGALLPTGVYVYVVRFNLKDNTVVERKGALNLIR